MPVRSWRAKLGVIAAVCGMAALCSGFNVPALALFTSGSLLIERDWRLRHPLFHGGIAERWRASLEFYRATHQNSTNRSLHVIGIPLIVVGALGLFASRPLDPTLSPVWLAAIAAFALGWLLNLIGHAAYEKRAPAFSEDPLSFLAGPIWDLQHLMKPRAPS